GTFAPQGWRLELRGIDGGAAQWARLKSVARTLERMGCDPLWPSAHSTTDPRTEIQPTFACWTPMAALAEATTKIRLGQLVTCALYRNPGYLAKVSACVDVISGARVDLGLGAGWKEDEFGAYGYPFPKIRERLDRMGDPGRHMTGLWPA